MKLTATNNFPNLKASVDADKDEVEARDRDDRLSLSATGCKELSKLLVDAKLGNEEGLHSCGADSYKLFDDMLRVRVSDHKASFAVKRDEGYWVDVTQTARGPWWKMLRNAILDGMQADLDEQMADDEVLEVQWAKHFEPKGKKKRS